MSSLAPLLLKFRGISDPRAALVQSMLASMGGGTAPQPTSAPPGVRTPALPGATPGATAPQPTAAPPRSQLYDSPPDMLSLYNQLSDYQSRQKRIDSGLGLLAAGIVQPRNADAVTKMFGGDAQDQQDPLSLILSLQQFQQAQLEKQQAASTKARMQAAVPAIAAKFGIPEETAQFLADNGQLDDFVLDQTKPKAAGVTVNNNLPSPGATALLEGFDKNTLGGLQALPDTVSDIQSIQTARQALNAKGGVISGSALSPATLQGRKMIAQVLGLPDKAADNTDLLMSAINDTVIKQVRNLAPASDTDVKWLESIAGSAQNMTPDNIARILDIRERKAHDSIVKANRAAQKRIDAESDAAVKEKLQGAFDAQKVEAPAFDDGYISRINPDDIVELRKDPSPDAIAEFDGIYGLGAAEQILAAANG